MIFLIHPDSTFFEWTNVLSEYSELDNAGSDSSRVCGNDDFPLAFLGRGHSYDLPVSFPLRYQQTVTAVDEDSNLSVLKIKNLGKKQFYCCKVSPDPGD